MIIFPFFFFLSFQLHHFVLEKFTNSTYMYLPPQLGSCHEKETWVLMGHVEFSWWSEVWEESREICSCEHSSLTREALLRCAQMEFPRVSLLWSGTFVALTAKQFMNKKPSLPSPLLMFTISCLPSLLFGKGLLFIHTHIFTRLEHTSMLITSWVIILGGDTHVSSWCLCGVLLRKTNRIEWSFTQCS